MSEGKSKEESFLEELANKLQSLEQNNASLKAIIYGSMGVGKTVAVMQIAQTLTPKGKGILYIDSAEGWVSLQNHPELKKRVKRWTDTEISTLKKIAYGIKYSISPWDKFGTIIIDEHSSITDEDLANITKQRAVVDKSKDPDDPKWPDMSTAKNRTLDYTGKFIKLDNVNVLMVAHERIDEDNLKRKVTSPSYMPATGKALYGLVHLVGRMTADESPSENSEKVDYTREVQVHPTNRNLCKTRIGGFSSIRVSVPELIRATKEWLQGEREVQETQEIKKDPKENVQTADELSDELLGE